MQIKLYIFLALSSYCCAQSPGDCIQKLEVPSSLEVFSGEPVPEVVYVQPEGGLVPVEERKAVARVEIGPGGAIRRIDVSSNSTGDLSENLRLFLSKNMSMSSRCSGKVITVEFIFRFGGIVRSRPVTKVSFMSPASFLIEREPGIAMPSSAR